MKYNEKNPPLVCMQTQSSCYRGTGKMQIKGVLWHDTGCNNPNLKRFVQPSDDAPDRAEWLEKLGRNPYHNDWNHVTRKAGMNCWIGKLADGTVATVQTMPWDYRPWGCGSGKKGSCNNGWIQFEICEDGKKDADYLNKVYEEACEITAYLCKLYNIDPLGTAECGGVAVPTILCHQDSARFGLGSDHSDIYDWFPKYGKSMETARNDVTALLASDNAAHQATDIIQTTPIMKPDSPPATEPKLAKDEPKAPTAVTIINSTGYVNIRNGNDTNFARITTARNGEKFPYIATAAIGWHAVLTKGQVCWVSGDYSKVQ